METKKANSLEAETTKVENTSLGHLQKLEKAIDYIRCSASCRICTRLMFEPYITTCGHSFCYSCLVHWFESHRRNKSCPGCRAPVHQMPIPEFSMRDIVHFVAGRAELLEADETVESLGRDREEEARIVERDKANAHPFKGGLFRGCFNFENRRGVDSVIVDDEDGVLRCATCSWELEDGWCERCALQYDVGESIATATDFSESLHSDTALRFLDFPPERYSDDISLDGDGNSLHNYEVHQSPDITLRRAGRITGIHPAVSPPPRRGRAPSVPSVTTSTDYDDNSEDHYGNLEAALPTTTWLRRRRAESISSTSTISHDSEVDPEMEGFIVDETEETPTEASTTLSSSDDPSTDGEEVEEEAEEEVEEEEDPSEAIRAPAILRSRRGPRQVVEISDEEEEGDLQPTATEAEGVSPPRDQDSRDSEDEGPDYDLAPLRASEGRSSRKRRRVLAEESSEDDQSDEVSDRCLRRCLGGHKGPSLFPFPDDLALAHGTR